MSTPFPQSESEIVAAGVTRSLDLLVEEGRPVTVRYTIAATLSRENSFPMYRRALDDLLAGRQHFVLDFAGAGYVDGKALEVLKALSYKVHEIKGVLVFENVNDDLYTLLQLTRFANLIDVRKAVRHA
jgi:anti-anti-sigma regulatory factor